MAKTICGAVIATGLLGLWGAIGRTEQPDEVDRKQTGEPNQVSVFMRAKLEHSQKVLEGLVIEDYKLIARHSQELSLLSLAAQWQVLQTPEYTQQSGEFRRAADAITKAAKEEKLDGAALAYVDMTIKCVNCHKHVRGARMAKLEAPPGEPPATRELTRAR